MRMGLQGPCENTSLIVGTVARAPHLLHISEGGSLDSRATGNVDMDGPKIAALAKTLRMGHPAG